MKEQLILLVEDDPNDEELTIRALEQSRIKNKVDVARDGAERLESRFGTGAYAGRDKRATPALVLLDLKLPKIDGLEVLRQIRANESTRLLPVIILTSAREVQDIVSGYALGANSYI